MICLMSNSYSYLKLPSFCFTFSFRFDQADHFLFPLFFFFHNLTGRSRCLPVRVWWKQKERSTGSLRVVRLFWSSQTEGKHEHRNVCTSKICLIQYLMIIWSNIMLTGWNDQRNSSIWFSLVCTNITYSHSSSTSLLWAFV